MDNFKSAIEKFLMNKLECDDLALLLEQVLTQTPTLFNEIQSYLTNLYQAERLSTNDYSKLNVKIRQVNDRIMLVPTIPRQTLFNDRIMLVPTVPRQTLSGVPFSHENDNFDLILAPGLVIGNYRLEKLLGKGGMGVVWKAKDLIQEAAGVRDCDVAIKFFSQDFKQHHDALNTLVCEFNRYKKLNHPKVVQAHNLNGVENTYFIVMELLKGIPLNEFIKNHPNGVPLTEAELIIKDMGDALAHAHKNGIAHMDFKPANVFYDPDEKIAKVIDFGIARPLDQSEREKTRFDPGDLGALTELYASYEMLLDREPDPRDDIYALACVSYQLLSGEHPFGRRETAITAKEKKLIPKPIKGLKPKQYKALLHGLAFQKNDRTTTVEQFLAELLVPVRPIKVFLVVSVVVMLVMGSAALVHFKWQPLVDKWLRHEITCEQSKLVLILTQADKYLQNRVLISRPGKGEGENAIEKYQQALKLCPSNKPAQEGLAEIAKFYKNKARYHLNKGHKKICQDHIKNGLRAVPDHKDLLALKAHCQ